MTGLLFHTGWCSRPPREAPSGQRSAGARGVAHRDAGVEGWRDAFLKWRNSLWAPGKTGHPSCRGGGGREVQWGVGVSPVISGFVGLAAGKLQDAQLHWNFR